MAGAGNGILHAGSGPSGSIAAGSGSNGNCPVSVGVGGANFVGGVTAASKSSTFRPGGTASQLYGRVSANSMTSGTMTVTLQIAATNGNQSFSIPNSGTGEFNDATDSDTFAAASRINILCLGAGGSNVQFVTFQLLSVLFAAATGQVIRTLNGLPNSSHSTTVFALYMGISNSLVNPTAEAGTQQKFRHAATISNLSINVSANAGGSASTLTSRKNGADANMSISIGAAATGVFEDTVDSDSLNATDTADLHYAPVSLTVGPINAQIAVADGTYPLATGAANGDTTVLAANTTKYHALADQQSSWNSTESFVSQQTFSSFSCAFMSTYITTNTVTATSTYTLRRNATHANQALSIGSSMTGLFEDTTDTDIFGPADHLTVQTAAGATGTSLNRSFFSLWASIPNFVPPAPPFAAAMRAAQR